MTLPACLALAGLGVALATVALLLWRSRDSWPALPAWTWKDIRQGVALLATIAGAGVLTLLAWWLIDRLYVLLARDVKSAVAGSIADGLVWGLKLLLAGVLGVILSLGLVIGRRQYRLKGPGQTDISMTNDDEDADQAPPPAA